MNEETVQRMCSKNRADPRPLETKGVIGLKKLPRPATKREQRDSIYSGFVNPVKSVLL